MLQALSRLVGGLFLWTALAGFANAEHIEWRTPAELQEQPIPAADAARYAAQDVRVSRFEFNDGRVLRRVIITDLPRSGRLATTPVSVVATSLSQSAGTSTCLSHTLSPVREFSVSGRAAVEVTLVCRGVVTPTETIRNQINVRRTILVEGQARLFMWQADEYARESDAFDPAASASRWDEAAESLIWCLDSTTARTAR